MCIFLIHKSLLFIAKWICYQIFQVIPLDLVIWFFIFIFYFSGDEDTLINSDVPENAKLAPGWHDNNCLSVVNLTYDVTPPEIVTSFATERGVLATSSVPVIIKKNFADVLGHD